MAESSSESTIIDLGAVAVLDPQKLHLGQYVTIDNIPFVINQLSDIGVGCRPVVGMELFLYRLRRCWKLYAGFWRTQIYAFLFCHLVIAFFFITVIIALFFSGAK